MKNNTNKYVNYLGGLVKGCNILACGFMSIAIMLVVYFFDGFNLLSALLAQPLLVKEVVLIVAVLGALLSVASTVKNLDKKHVTFADNAVLTGAFLFVLLLVYFLISKSQKFFVYELIFLACLLVAVLALFFLRAKFFVSVEREDALKPNATFATYYQNLFKKYWPFIIILSAMIVVLLVFLFNSTVIQDLINANNTYNIVFSILAVLVTLFVLLYSVRIEEKEQNLIDSAMIALMVTACGLAIMGFMSEGKLRIATIILAGALLVFAIALSLILVKHTVLYSNDGYKVKKGNFALYFKNLFKDGNVVLYVGIALLLTAVVAVLEATNFIHEFYEHELSGKDPTVVIETICLIIIVVFTFLLTELKGHKIHIADKISFTFAVASALILIVVNGVLGVEFIFEGLIAAITLVISCAYIAGRIFFIKDLELVKEAVEESVEEAPVTVEKEEQVVEETSNEVETEQAVTEEEVVKLKRVNVKKSFEIYVRTGDEQLKQNYSQIKNALLSYGLHSRITKTRENFSKKGVTLSKVKEGKEIRLQAKLMVRGKFLKLYLNVNPESVDLKYFRASDVSLKMPDQPLYLKIRSKLSLKRALELIDLLAVQENFNAKKKHVDVDYASLLTSDGLTYMQKLGYDYMVKDSVTYEEVAILNDEWAEKIVKTELIKDPDRYIYDEVTLKDLEDNFEDGSVVSLEAMRQKGIVKINSNHITVKASNSLSKKLIVEGNVIEPKAVAMIFIAGGEATRLIGE